MNLSGHVMTTLPWKLAQREKCETRMGEIDIFSGSMWRVGLLSSRRRSRPLSDGADALKLFWQFTNTPRLSGGEFPSANKDDPAVKRLMGRPGRPGCGRERNVARPSSGLRLCPTGPGCGTQCTRGCWEIARGFDPSAGAHNGSIVPKADGLRVETRPCFHPERVSLRLSLAPLCSLSVNFQPDRLEMTTESHKFTSIYKNIPQRDAELHAKDAQNLIMWAQRNRERPQTDSKWPRRGRMWPHGGAK